MTEMPDEGGLSIGAEFAVQLKAGLDGLSRELRLKREKEGRLVQNIHYFTVPAVPISLTGSAPNLTGTLNQPTLFGPRTGMMWDVKRITATGYTTGSVNVYLNSTSGDQVLSFPSVGNNLMGKAQLLLQPNDALVFNATGITGTVAIQIAGIELAASCLGDYLL